MTTELEGEDLRMGTARGRWVLCAAILGASLAMLDATVVNVALRRIGEDFDAGFAGLQWTVNAYTLSLAALILLGGSLGDRLGRRRVFVVGVGWFAVASVLCGMAVSIEMLVAARVLQGIGGALLTPGSLAIISASFHSDDRAAAIGAWSGFGGLAAAIGPLVGGWLVDWSWRAVFWVNVPVALLVVLVTLRFVPESRDDAATGRLDVVGTVLAVVGLASLTYGLTALGETGAAPATVLAVVGGLAVMVAFVGWERRAPDPLVPMQLFAHRQFGAANVLTFLVYAALGVLFVLLVLQLQVVAEFSPVLAGSAMLPVTVIMLLFSSRAGALAQRIGPRLPLTVGPLLASAGVLWMAGLDAEATYLADVVPPAVVFGSGLALLVAPLTATVLGAAPDRYAGTASGVNNAVARAAGLLALAVVPALAGLRGDAAADPAGFGDGYVVAMRICAGLLLAGAVVGAVWMRGPGPADPAPQPGEVIHVEEHHACAIGAPGLHPSDAACHPHRHT